MRLWDWLADKGCCGNWNVSAEPAAGISGFAGAVGKAGADFKRQFTFESYQEFFTAAGYTDVKHTMIEGRVPCAVAVIRKGEHSEDDEVD